MGYLEKYYVVGFVLSTFKLYMATGNKITKALARSIDAEAINVLKDGANLGWESLITNDAFKHVPIVGTLLSIYKVGATMKEWNTLKKLAIFLTKLETKSEEERIAFLTKLEREEDYKETLFENLLLVIERLDATKKAEIVGNLTRAYVTGVITRDKLWRLVGIVEKAPLEDLMLLYDYYNELLSNRASTPIHKWSKTTEISLYNLGLMQQNLDLTEATKKAVASREGYGPIAPNVSYSINGLGRLMANIILYEVNVVEYHDFLTSIKAHAELYEDY